MMPVLRYFVVMGCCLLGLLFAVDLMWPGEREAKVDYDFAPVVAAKPSPTESRFVSPVERSAGETQTLGWMENRRYSEQRFERTKQDSSPVVYPNIAALAPTPDRLQWERQLRYLPANHVYEARAEMPKEAIPEQSKPTAKTATRKQLAHARPARIAPEVERPRYARNAGWDPFGLFD
ncbi:hypothetical protein [Nitrobacter sp. TKz-YC01]|uniref:hypothetical protein n=2 Tax=unclassified Nitrobacter TaxID=2620411 RepID=UPI002C2141C5|nr:hypothetical protein [Nitrobacter sp.]